MAYSIHARNFVRPLYRSRDVAILPCLRFPLASSGESTEDSASMTRQLPLPPLSLPAPSTIFPSSKVV